MSEAPAPLPDADGLLVSLVLLPAAFPRNRFFSLYRDEGMAKVRRRAAELRGLLRDLAGRRGVAVVEHDVRDEHGAAQVSYRIDALGLRVTAVLSAVEAAAIDVALSRLRGLPVPASAQAVVEAHLLRLGRFEAPGA